MITEWLMNLGLTLGLELMDGLPSFDEFDGVIVTAGTYLFPLAAGAGSLGAWIPFPLIAFLMAIIFPLYVTAALFKFARALFAHVPFVGGKG